MFTYAHSLGSLILGRAEYSTRWLVWVRHSTMDLVDHCVDNKKPYLIISNTELVDIRYLSALALWIHADLRSQ